MNRIFIALLLFSSMAFSQSFEPTANYSATNDNTELQLSVGTMSSPVSFDDSIAIFQKTTDSDGDSGGVNSTAYFSIRKMSSGAGTRAMGIFTEAEDRIGSQYSYIEGIRGHATLISGTGGGYGGVFMAGTAIGTGYQYLIGAEAESRNQSGTDAPSLLNKNGFSAGFVASAQGTNHSDAGYVTNPWNPVNAKFRTGFLVGSDSVTGAAFRSQSATQWGLDLTQGSQSIGAIGIPNLTAVRATNAAKTSNLNILYLDTANRLVLGQESSATVIQPAAGQLLVGAGDVQLLGNGKGIILKNAAGTITKRVRLNDAGTGLIFEDP